MDAEGRGHKTHNGRTNEDGKEPQEGKKVQPGRKTAASAKPPKKGILPKVAAEDEPRSWGDDGGYDHDAWLKEQRPPHWG